MKKKRMFALLLAGCCLLTGCSGASQEGDPAGESPEALQSGLVQKIGRASCRERVYVSV